MTVLAEGDVDESMLNFACTTRVARMRREREERRNSPEARKTTFVMHSHARAHDYFGCYALLNEGWRRGLVVGEFEVISDRAQAPDETDADKLIAMGVIPICVGKTPWSKPSQETTDISVVKNIVRWLGLENDPVWKRIAEWEHTVFSPPGPGNWEKTLGMVRTLSLGHMDEQLEVYRINERILDSIRAEIEEEQAAEAELPKLHVNEKPIVHRGRAIKMGLIETDACLIARISRRKPLEVDVLVRLDSTGHVIISGGRNIDFSKVAANLRREEAARRGQPEPKALTATRLSSPDDIWYLKRNRPGDFEALINGGYTADLPPTSLNLEELAIAVYDGLQEG